MHAHTDQVVQSESESRILTLTQVKLSILCSTVSAT